MALESFYGGKQGVSPVIKAKFETREDLGEAFSNSGYKDVWFSELAIIDSPNKLNKDNGKIYRRTLPTTVISGDYASNPDYAGPNAEYIGQIVGPAGGIPNVILTDLTDLQNKANGDGINETDQILFPISDGESSWIQSNKPLNEEENFYITNGSTQQVPGKNGEIYNDTIKYSWFNILKPNSNESEDNQTAYIYLGFEIPYPVFNFSIGVSNYNNNSTIIEDGSQEHPYYWNYHVTIPRGIRGIWQEINLGTIDEFYNVDTKTWRKNIYHNIEDLIYNEDTDSYSIRSDAPTAENDFKIDQNNFKEKDTQFWYLIVKCPKLNDQLSAVNNYPVEIDEFYFYLEDFKVLKNVTFNDTNGNITLIYNNNDIINLEDMYSYPSNLYFTPGDKAFAVEYNGVQPNTNENTHLYWDPESEKYFIKDPYTNGKIYWNVIEDIYTDLQNNVFYILFSSNHFEPYIDNPNPYDTYIDENGKLWTYCPSPSNTQQRWWYTVSPIYETKQGIRIVTTLDLKNYTGSLTSDEMVDPEKVINALNSQENWNGGNPYLDGRNGKNGWMNGEFGIYEGYAFYYDKINNTWATIGAWTDASASEHQIYINNDEDKAKNYSIGINLQSLSYQNIVWPNLNI